MDTDTNLSVSIDYLEEVNNTSSLEDVYGYKVFSKDFEKQITNTQNNEQKELQNSYMSVFTNRENNSIEVAYKTVMNAPTGSVVKNDYSNVSGNNPSMFAEIGFVLIGILVAGVVLFCIDKGLKNRHAKKNNTKI